MNGWERGDFVLLEHFFFELLDELHFGVLKATADQDLEDGFCLQFEVEELVFAELGGDIDAFGLWLVLWSGLLIVIDLMVERKGSSIPVCQQSNQASLDSDHQMAVPR